MIITIDDESIPLAGDWHAFTESVRTFGGERRQLRHFVEYGWCQDLNGLASDLDLFVLDAHLEPRSESTATWFMDLIDGRESAEVLAISDGPERAVVETFREQELEWCLEV